MWCKMKGTTIDVMDTPFDENTEVQTLALTFLDSLLEADELGELFGGISAGLFEVLASGRRLIGLVLWLISEGRAEIRLF